MNRLTTTLRAKYKITLFMGAKARLLACLLACLLLAPAPALAADITIDGVVGVNVYGNSSTPDGANNSGAPTGNTLSLISGANVGGAAYGARNDSANVTGNRVMVYDGATIGGNIHGGHTSAAGTFASNNSIHISGGTINSGIICGGWSTNGNSSGNLVRISGGSYSGTSIYGGRAHGDTSAATGNRVIIESLVSGLDNVYGGLFAEGAKSFDNVLDLKAPGLSIGGDLRHFQYINFYMPPDWTLSDPLLNVGQCARVEGATMTLVITDNSSPLSVGDKITLIHAQSGFEYVSPTVKGVQGYSLLYDLKFEFDNFDLYAEVLGVRANPGIKAFMEAQIAGMAFLNQAGDIVAGPGMYSALDNAKTARDRRFTFGTISGGVSRYKSGSHVDVEGLSMLAGLGWNFALNRGKAGNLLLGPFVEAGLGSYDSYNSFRDYASVEGDGDIKYYGAGVMARYSSPFGLYVDGSARVGVVETDFNSSDLSNPMSGEKAYYETSAMYYGGHLGLGYLQKIYDPLVLDIYSKFFITQQGSDKTKMAGERYKFDEISSQRSRTGARLSHEAKRKSRRVFAPYLGAALDYEFDAEAAGTVQGRDIDKADITGATGMGELGFAYKSAKGSFSIDLGVQGYVGKRTGGSGSLQAKWEF